MGEGRVVHFTGPSSSSFSSSSSSSSSSASIRKVCSSCEMFEHSDRDSGVIVSCLDCFLDSGWLRRYEYGVGKKVYWLRRRGTCNTAESSAAVVVLERAESLLANNGFGKYNVLKTNCEDFATFCKTGQGCDRNGTARGYGQASVVPTA
ncbi:protein LEAD-SENSITIVE 1-like [Salvia miltiorrhiza]|uniref:protein LEAD-SENSITIVE 1-like n=1 Tax=Salvia miltiorrhiza TaxID=226208 RepID=UPI0025AD6754|nr:protein LEAD-SENSITIVE 1-like [Salvia miltiorrhiza]